MSQTMKKLTIIISVIVLILSILFGIYAVAQLSDPHPSEVSIGEEAFLLGMKYKNRDYLFLDIDKSTAYLKRAYDLEHDQGGGEYLINIHFYESKFMNCEQAVKIADNLLLEGEVAGALFVKGEKLRNKKCPLYDIPKAIDYLTRADIAGSPQAAGSLSYIFGVDKNDSEQSKKWLKISSKNLENVAPRNIWKSIYYKTTFILDWYFEKMKQILE